MLMASLLLLSGYATNHQQPTFDCRDTLAVELHDAGWTGEDNRIAWTIAQRESNGDPTVVSQGAYGLFQLQADVWSGASWWDWDTVLTVEGNISMAYELWQHSGWSPWGLADDGGFDFSDYSMWSGDQIQSWIVEPYQYYYSQYPCEG